MHARTNRITTDIFPKYALQYTTLSDTAFRFKVIQLRYLVDPLCNYSNLRCTIPSGSFRKYKSLNQQSPIHVGM
jgi:hypothetical protein